MTSGGRLRHFWRSRFGSIAYQYQGEVPSIMLTTQRATTRPWQLSPDHLLGPAKQPMIGTACLQVWCSRRLLAFSVHPAHATGRSGVAPDRRTMPSPKDTALCSQDLRCKRRWSVLQDQHDRSRGPAACSSFTVARFTSDLPVLRSPLRRPLPPPSPTTVNLVKMCGRH